MKYQITLDYIDIGNSRPGISIEDAKFIVSHDTGNPGSTAYANRNYFNDVQPTSSAHTFIDDKYILEIIPLDEKAWHVRYGKPTDNDMYGEDANDAAIGVELCFGGNIDFWQAYDRYVWYHAYLVDKYALDPDKDIVAHSTLDPERRTDPQNALHRYGVSWSQFISDVKKAYQVHFTDQGDEVPEWPDDVKGIAEELPIGIGDEGQYVKEIQQDLIKAGFSLPVYGADGVFGEETETAVMKFQRKYGLTVDGLVGPETLGKLKEVLSAGKPVLDFPLPDKILQLGDTGLEVKQLQRALNHINFDPGYIDGVYGPLTKGAVKRFQSMYAVLTNDGIYGPNTKKYIRMELERLA